MKKIVIQKNVINNNPTPWLMPIAAWLSYLLSLTFSTEPSRTNVLFGIAAAFTIMKIVSYLANRKPKHEDEKILIFGTNSLVYRDGEVTVWHIPYERLSHIQPHIYGSGRLFDPKYKLILVHTIDGDSNSLPNFLSENEIYTIQTEIEKTKSDKSE